MDFFNDLGKTLNNVARQVGEKSGELLDVGRWNMDILKQEDAIRKVYRKIGEQIYTEYDKGENYAGTVDELCEEIRRRKSKIEFLNVKLKEAKKAEKRAEEKAETKAGKEEEEVKDPLEKDRKSKTGPDQTAAGINIGDAEEVQSNSGNPATSYFEAAERMQKREKNE